HLHISASSISFYFKSIAPTDIYTLSLHDALPIFSHSFVLPVPKSLPGWNHKMKFQPGLSYLNPESVVRILCHWQGTENHHKAVRSEEHTSELQSRENLVCRLLLEKKK